MRRMMSLTACLLAVMAIGWDAVAYGGGCRARAYCGGCTDPCAVYAPCGGSVVCGKSAGPVYVEKTVMVPTWVNETRTVMCTEYQQQQRARTFTVYRQVPETKQVEQTYTVMVPEVHTKTVEYTVNVPVTEERTCQVQVCVPVWEEVERQYTVRVPRWREVEREVTVCVPVTSQVEQTYTVMVPHQEVRTGTRSVCRCVPVTETRTITCDRGHWETQVVEVPCTTCCYRRGCGKGCGSCCCVTTTRTCCQKVWVPNVVTEEIDVTCYKYETVEEPYECTVTVCRPEQRTRMVNVCSYEQQTRVHKSRVCDYESQVRTCTQRVCRYEMQTREQKYRVCSYRPEVRTREVKYTVCTPQTRSRTCNVTTYRCVPEERTENYTVCVPVQVEKQVQVQCCKMVPQTVQVPVCQPTCTHHYGCGCGHGLRRGCGC